MKTGVRLGALLLALISLTNPTARAADPAQPDLSTAEEADLIAKVKASWHAQTGETADQVIAFAAKTTHFVPREWSGWAFADGTKGAAIGWAKRRKDPADETLTIQWTLHPDGTASLDNAYTRPMDLGSTAFALSLIQSEVNDGIRSANVRFLRDLHNLNFLSTPQGKLGDLLSAGHCVLRAGDPVGIDYGPLSRSTDRKGFRVQLSVDCRTAGPTYFTKDGVILFERDDGQTAWKPWSFFAVRLAKYPPGHWFEGEEPAEEQVLAGVAAKALEAGMTPNDAAAMAKLVELRNDGDMIHY